MSSPQFNHIVGNNIRQLRRAQGLHQAALAKKLHWLPATLCYVERGKTNLRAFDLVKIAGALNCRPADLLNGTGPAVL